MRVIASTVGLGDRKAADCCGLSCRCPQPLDLSVDALSLSLAIADEPKPCEADRISLSLQAREPRVANNVAERKRLPIERDRVNHWVAPDEARSHIIAQPGFGHSAMNMTLRSRSSRSISPQAKASIPNRATTSRNSSAHAATDVLILQLRVEPERFLRLGSLSHRKSLFSAACVARRPNSHSASGLWRRQCDCSSLAPSGRKTEIAQAAHI